jgi:Ca-activated chloride channel family protein
MKKLILLSLLLVSGLYLNAQEITITGTVTDNSELPLPGVNIQEIGSANGTQTDWDGRYSIKTKVGKTLKFVYVGSATVKRKVELLDTVIDVTMKPSKSQLDQVVISAYEVEERPNANVVKELKGQVQGLNVGTVNGRPGSKSKVAIRGMSSNGMTYNQYNNPKQNRESYQDRDEKGFKMTGTSPLSTFSIDVDKAGYSNLRRMLNRGQEIPKNAVKIEEMVNYFNYDYPQPTGNDPFSINLEVAKSPWNTNTELVKIGLQGKIIPQEDFPPSNLVFLIDVSGSMHSRNKLPLLKSAFKLLVKQLRPEDKISMVVYAGAAGLVLKPTSGDEKNKINEAIDKLEAGGSTAGGAGINLAYKTAEENFMDAGNNRVILATDGDFNVGANSDQAMEDLIKEKRKSGVFLTCLGFGMGNYQDSKMEKLADQGNGNHSYIDNMQEAQRVLGTEFGGTLYTIAKDVKIQVEFNPAKVAGYRLIGYENRMLDAEDFNDDKKDAGELGSGHKVTALYEIIPPSVKSKYLKDIDNLKYSERKKTADSDELLTVKFRYKKPDGDKSKLIVTSLKAKKAPVMQQANADFQFASAVALFGMKLKETEYAENLKTKKIIELAEAGRGSDKDGYRAEFIRLVKSME